MITGSCIIKENLIILMFQNRNNLFAFAIFENVILDCFAAAALILLSCKKHQLGQCAPMTDLLHKWLIMWNFPVISCQGCRFGNEKSGWYDENTFVDDTSKCGFETMDEGSVILVNVAGREVHNPARFPPSFLIDHLFAIR